MLTKSEMTIAERNRAIKKVLEQAFGRGKVRVRGSRGTAYGWVSVHIAYAPKDRDELKTLESKVWDLFAAANIKIGTYGTPGDMGCDYGWGSKIHLDFDQCRDIFNTGETVKTCTGHIATIKERDYRAGGDWYLILFADGTTEQFYKNDLVRVQS